MCEQELYRQLFRTPHISSLLVAYLTTWMKTRYFTHFVLLIAFCHKPSTVPVLDYDVILVYVEVVRICFLCEWSYEDRHWTLSRKSGTWGDRDNWGNFVGSSLENNVHHPYTIMQFLSNGPLMKLLFVGSRTKNRMFGHCWKWILLTRHPWCPSCPDNNVKVLRGTCITSSLSNWS